MSDVFSHKKFFHTPYSKSRPSCGLDCGSDSVVQQHDKDRCDINSIVKRAKRLGFIDHVNSKPAKYMCCTQVSYQEALNRVTEAQKAFSSLSAEERFKFNNNVEDFLAFASDPEKNSELLRKTEIKDDVTANAGTSS